MTVTAADIKALPSGEFTSLEDVVIEKFITRAGKLVDEGTWDDLYDDAVELMAAHMLVGPVGGGVGSVGPVTSESAGPFSRSYAAPSSNSNDDLSSTTYGRQLQQLRMTLGPVGFCT